MDRISVLNSLITQTGRRRYLEIGVFNGSVFFKLKSWLKVAVDPAFRFGFRRIVGKVLGHPFNVSNQYYQKTSDDFFLNDAPTIYKRKKIELCLIDGMHEYRFALRDLENTVRHMTDSAVIILHDCNPQTELAASSFPAWEARQFRDDWNGDVWKTILHIRSLRRDLTAFVLDCDYGLGVVVKRENEALLPYTEAQISDFTYQDLTVHRKEWLGLVPDAYFYEFFKIIPPAITE